jgi:hypothetical protein
MIKNWLEHLDNYYKGKDLDLMLSKKIWSILERLSLEG